MITPSAAPLETERLIIRRWLPNDIEPFAAMNADERVMAFMPNCLSPNESRYLLDRINAHFDQHGFSLWALEHKETAQFIGYTGLLCPTFDAFFTPCVEIGWRLAFEQWNQGLATEAAKRIVTYAFTDLALPELVSFTTQTNTASRRVMEKLGMTHNPNDQFLHPQLTPDHPLCAHVLYRLKNHRIA